MSEYRTAWERYWAHFKDYADANACIGMAHNDHDRIRALEGCISRLLLSADTTWEEQRMGHDWAEAVAEARATLQRPDDHRQPRQDDRPDGRADG